MSDIPHDEADNIRRWSPGDKQSARDGGANSISSASISGGFWFGIFALIFSAFAISMAWTRTERHGELVQQAVADARIAAERADKAERSAALSREYAVSAFFQTQVEWAKRGVVIESPLEEHDPIPESAYEDHDEYVEGEQ